MGRAVFQLINDVVIETGSSDTSQNEPLVRCKEHPSAFPRRKKIALDTTKRDLKKALGLTRIIGLT